MDTTLGDVRNSPSPMDVDFLPEPVKPQTRVQQTGTTTMVNVECGGSRFSENGNSDHVLIGYFLGDIGL